MTPSLYVHVTEYRCPCLVSPAERTGQEVQNHHSEDSVSSGCQYSRPDDEREPRKRRRCRISSVIHSGPPPYPLSVDDGHEIILTYGHGEVPTTRPQRKEIARTKPLYAPRGRAPWDCIGADPHSSAQGWPYPCSPKERPWKYSNCMI